MPSNGRTCSRCCRTCTRLTKICLWMRIDFNTAALHIFDAVPLVQSHQKSLPLFRKNDS
ncbi:hypothetical protein FMM82_16345 [[Clostridium] clostridioforme]|nr:hypothetical protein [Enterocloster clostridioformis]